jgi:serine/threonine protein kinase
MGEVYLAATTGIEGAERPCVVKIIRREHASNSSFVARFLDEARVQAQLHHPGVVQVIEADTDEQGEPYVVVEYVEGRSLGEVRSRCADVSYRLSWAEAVALAASTAEALAHIHERVDVSGQPLSIVHRDMSPQNIMVGYGGDVKLIDFGTALGENRRSHTVAGVVFAKPGYVAPEVANGNTGNWQDGGSCKGKLRTIWRKSQKINVLCRNWHRWSTHRRNSMTSSPNSRRFIRKIATQTRDRRIATWLVCCPKLPPFRMVSEECAPGFPN